ncbi:glycosyltransferase [Corynebacterium suedekumii]|nr:glycosyltransferase [Corynebacterium suedekumii]
MTPTATPGPTSSGSPRWRFPPTRRCATVSATAASISRCVRFAPDVIHAVNPVWLAGYGVLASRRLRVPLVASFHTNVPEYTTELGIGWLRAPAQRAISFLHSRAAVNLCTSGPMVDKARGLGMPNVRLWPKRGGHRQLPSPATHHPDAGTTERRRSGRPARGLHRADQPGEEPRPAR